MILTDGVFISPFIWFQLRRDLAFLKGNRYPSEKEMELRVHYDNI